MDIKDYDSIMIESKDKIVTKKSFVCISPFNFKTQEWIVGMNEITTMENALSKRCKKVCKDDNVRIFLEEYYKN